MRPARNACAAAASRRRILKSAQPPTSRRPRNTSGANPATIRKNCSTSL